MVHRCGPGRMFASPEQGRGYQRLIGQIREWDEAHKGQNARGPEEDDGFLTADDMAVTGWPGNLGKLRKG